MVRLGALSLLLARSALAAPDASLHYRGLYPGELMLVAVERQAPGKTPAGTLDGAPLEFFAASTGVYLAFAAFDLEAATGARRVALRLEGEDGTPLHWGAELRLRPKEFPLQRLTVKQDYVTPKEEDEERAARELERLQALFAAPSPEARFSGNFQSPIPKAVSSRFGERRIFNGVRKAPHSGADLRAAAGVAVRAPAGGRVVLAEGLFYQGNTVVLDHGAGLFSYYAHLSEFAVMAGDDVGRGALLGKVGATGRVTGPHLHWSVRLREARVDPYSLVAIDLNAWLRPLTRRPVVRAATRAGAP